MTKIFFRDEWLSWHPFTERHYVPALSILATGIRLFWKLAMEYRIPPTFPLSIYMDINSDGWGSR